MDLMVRAPLFLNQSLRVGTVELFGCDWEGATWELGFTLILIGPNFRDCRWTDFDALQTWPSVTHFLTQVAIDSLHILCITRQDEAYSDYARRWRRRPHRKVQQVSQHQALGRMASVGMRLFSGDETILPLAPKDADAILPLIPAHLADCF